ncbi:alpha/beta hydrolase [Halonotius aquaticus]|uniref:Alpha/beta hydrolase n=1 Tax=Halonotius aquaticus TaxID=2216978 RepID=A0A3A6QDS5_9EURY|nr:alpha/beta hydrolase [Halonotius aquaticus]RJX44891.1 alpha/beta hydrolase [Halonotius aquaticus]
MVPEEVANKPAVVDPSTITLENGDTIAYGEYGDPEGNPIVLFHGTPGSRLLGALFDDIAATAGVRLLTFDRPGFGQSDPCPTRSITDAGRYVTTVLDDAEIETTALLAFSGGSQHAIATAATDDDRVARVDIVSGATPPAASDATPAMQRALGMLATHTPTVLRGLFRGQAWMANRRDPSFVVSQYRGADPDTPIDEQVAAVVKADFLEAVANSRQGVVTEFRNTATEWEIEFSALDVPIVIWHGDNDTNVPIENAQQFAEETNGALRVTENGDHLQTLVESVPTICEAWGK